MSSNGDDLTERGGGRIERVVSPLKPEADTTRPSRWRQVGRLLAPRRLEKSAGSQTLVGAVIAGDLLADARLRVRRLGFAVLISSLVLVAGDLLATAIGWLPRVGPQLVPLSLVLLVVSFGLIASSRSSHLDDRKVLWLGFGYVVFVAALAGFAHAVHMTVRYGQVVGFGPFTILIAVFPLILPCPPRAALWVALSASVATFGGVFAATQFGWAKATSTSWADLTVVMVGNLALAVAISRLIHRLQADIDHARRLGSYQLEELIGSGGMGEVWRGRHAMLARPAAIKLMRSPVDRFGLVHPAALERFRREARVTAALRSPHTVELYDFGTGNDGTVFYAMELLDGIDLGALVRRFGPQPVARVQGILLQACDSLAEAHEFGLVHRDIKPENLMLCRQGRQIEVLKVLDFGIVALLPGDADAAAAAPPAFRESVVPEALDLTRPGAFLGTLAYSAPEILEGQAASPRSDLFSLGSVAYWLLTGRKLIQATSPAQQAEAILNLQVIPPSAQGIEIDSRFERIVLACLEKDPANRPESAEDLATSLAQVGGCWDTAAAREWWQKI